MSNNSKATIMVVDDDPKIVKALALRLNAAGYKTITTFNGVRALVLAQLNKPDLIITDMWMPEGSGLSMAYRVKELLPGTPLIFLTASKQSGLDEKARLLGAAGYLEKPYEPGALLEMVSQLLAAAGRPHDEEESNLTEAAVS
jgi:CheY-like chemotaxis protein